MLPQNGSAVMTDVHVISQPILKRIMVGSCYLVLFTHNFASNSLPLVGAATVNAPFWLIAPPPPGDDSALECPGDMVIEITSESCCRNTFW